MGLFKKKKPIQLEPTPQFNQYDYQNKIIPYIKKVFIGEAYAEYLGGSLCISLHRMKGIIHSTYEKDEMICISVSDKKWNEEVRFYAGLCYIKYKGGNPNMVEESINNCNYNPQLAVDLIFKYLVE